MIDLKGAIGIRSALSLEDYHNLPPKSAHFLMAAAENCEKAQYDDEHPKPQTKPQARGHLIHTGIEVDSEDDLLKFYATNPPHLHGNYLRTNAGKAEMKEFKDECQQAGKIAIKEEEFDMAIGCRRSVYNNDDAARFLENSRKEVSGFCTLNGIDVKARPDLDCSAKLRTLVDIKSRQGGAAEIGKWMKDFYNYKTYIQAGLQMKVWRTLKMEVDEYYYILVEIEKPYLVNVVYLSEDWIHHSIVKTSEAILKWKSWLGNGCPAGYGEVQEMRMAPWQQKLMEED